jgi:hypothetical protein
LARPRAAQARKKLSLQVVLGQKGINLIERIVLDMDCIWSPTGPIDVGIDGTIELCDQATREPLGIFLHVQSKATDVPWERETEREFYYPCRPQDLDYWMQGNAPVLLVVSRPATSEAYWISVKDHFQNPVRRQSRRAHFVKEKDRFFPGVYPTLFDLAKPRDVGLYLAPAPRPERLISNLLEVTSFASRIYVAQTSMRQRPEVWKAFEELGTRCPAEWLLKDKQVVTFHDLREFPWDHACDRGTVEEFAVEEWAHSPDPDRLRDFVHLLNGALQEKLFPQVRPWRKLGVYAFTATRDLSPRKIPYASHTRAARCTVFEVYTQEWNGRTYTHYRHMAIHSRFRLYDDRWYLEITPTYVYTKDGRSVHRRHSEWLKGIKRLDKNRAVLAQLMFWAQYLQGTRDLFTEPYPYLSFGRLAEFTLPVGIDDDAWQARDEVAQIDSGYDDGPAGGLFSDDD